MPEEDDWLAFSSIQTARYLMGKNKRTFSTMAEKDMIADLIHDHWIVLVSSGELEGKSSCDKLNFFRKVSIVFPTAGLGEPRLDSQVIGVNFQTQKKVELGDRCLCGSGLPFALCCGRTPANEELLTGIF